MFKGVESSKGVKGAEAAKGAGVLSAGGTRVLLCQVQVAPQAFSQRSVSARALIQWASEALRFCVSQRPPSDSQGRSIEWLFGHGSPSETILAPRDARGTYTSTAQAFCSYISTWGVSVGCSSGSVFAVRPRRALRFFMVFVSQQHTGEYRSDTERPTTMRRKDTPQVGDLKLGSDYASCVALVAGVGCVAESLMCGSEDHRYSWMFFPVGAKVDHPQIL